MQTARLFERLKRGDHSVIQLLVEAEAPLAFDYLVRMSGAVDSSAVILKDLPYALESSIDDCGFEDYQEFRTEIYLILRRFSQASWTEDTSMLFQSPSGDSLAEKLGALKADLRELVLLRYRCQFSVEDIASICVLSEAKVESDLGDIVETLGLKSPEREVFEIVLFPLETAAGSQHGGSVAVSQIMGDIEELNRWGRFKKLLGFLFFFTVVLGVLFYFYKDQIGSYLTIFN